MDFISGSFDSLVSLSMAMSQAELKSQLAVTTLKKGLELGAQNAVDLIAAAQLPPGPANTPQTGQLIDVVA